MQWNSNRDTIETDYYLLRDDEHGEEKEYKLWVKVSYISSEKSFFDGMTGNGHPGSPAEIEVTSITLDGKDFELTDSENKKLEEFLWDHLNDSDENGDDDFNIEDERERQEDEERDAHDREHDGLDF
jgi:hypothetical protein